MRATVSGTKPNAPSTGWSPDTHCCWKTSDFHPGEEKNDPEFAVRLAELADVYVNDAFGVAHRAHASTEGVARLLPSAAGLLMERELKMLGRALDAPKRPFTAIIGGAKVSDKMAVLQNLSRTVDTLIVGGGMAATFLKARGLPVGDSMVEDDRVKFARSFAERAAGGPFRLLLPTDVVVADSFAETANHFTVDVSEIPEGWRIMDIGPRSVANFREGLAGSKTVLWNGPMGVSEWAPFAAGTAGVRRRGLRSDERLYHSRGRIDGRGGGPSGDEREDDTRIDGRGRVAGVPGGQGIAGLRRTAGQDRRVT